VGRAHTRRVRLQYQTVRTNDAASFGDLAAPKQLREMLPAEERSNRQITRPSLEVVDLAFQMFWSAMAPLREAGKLGMIAFQFPPYFIPKPANLDTSRAFPNVCREPRSQSSSVTRAGFATKFDVPKP
jgi:uncharacterized protein YecE (DUF72 family)